MKKLIGLFALAAMSTFAAEITGFVGDASCGAKHADASEAATKCATSCVKRGSPRSWLRRTPRFTNWTPIHKPK